MVAKINIFLFVSLWYLNHTVFLNYPFLLGELGEYLADISGRIG